MDNVLGLLEKIRIKEREILAKVDTGASRSSIDVKLAKELGLGPVIKTKDVKNVHGRTARPIVKTSVIINGRKLTASFNLSDRKEMGYKILIGKNILKRGFLIDPSK